MNIFLVKAKHALISYLKIGERKGGRRKKERKELKRKKVGRKKREEGREDRRG